MRIHVFRAHKPDDLKRTKLIEDYFPNESLPPSALAPERTDPQSSSAQLASDGELRSHEPYCTWAMSLDKQRRKAKQKHRRIRKPAKTYSAFMVRDRMTSNKT